MGKYTTKLKVVVAGLVMAILAFIATNVVGIQDYQVTKKTVPTLMPTATVAPTAIPTASPSATLVPVKRVVTQPVAKPTI